MLNPDLEICDAHVHLRDGEAEGYRVQELERDIEGSGHNVVSAIYVEYLSSYRTSGPAHLRSVGETEFAVRQAAISRGGRTPIAGIVAHVDLAGADVEDAVAVHRASGGPLLRGFRHVASWSDDPDIRPNHLDSPAELLRSAAFRKGARVVSAQGLAVESWVFHTQLDEVAELAREVPELTIVLDHLGGPVGIGRYADRGDALRQWRALLVRLAECENVYLKLGGLGLPIFGMAWHKARRATRSEDLASAWGDDVRFAIDEFGPDRCMFESNFPVDARCWSYRVAWNAYKRIAAEYTPAERRALFKDTAHRAYRVSTDGVVDLQGHRAPSRGGDR